MKIALLTDAIPPEGKGGAERVAWSVATGLQAAGHEVSVITSTPLPSLVDRRAGIAVHHLHAGYPRRWQAWLSLYNPQTIRPLRRLLEQLKPDVVHAHNIHMNLSYAALSTAYHLGFRVVFTSHDAMPFAYGKLTHWVDPHRCGVETPAQYRLPCAYNLRQMRLRYNPIRNAAIRFVLTHHVQARTCVSEAHRQALEANGLPPFQVIYNGLDPVEFDTPDLLVGALRERLNLQGRRVILFAGRLTAEKGSEQALAALNQVVARVPDTILLILSPKPIRSGRLEYARLIDSHARLGGWLDGTELAAAYHLADVVILPSIILECGGMVALEGMAARKPVVATCYGGPPELVADGKTGYVVNPFDTDAFADRLVRLLTDAELRRQMGEAGRRRVEAQFSLTGQIAHFLAIYQEATAHATTGTPSTRV
ncbi:MAG: glycosyltransferase family 4 protein [Aggregatilineales bacterium]